MHFHKQAMTLFDLNARCQAPGDSYDKFEDILAGTLTSSAVNAKPLAT